MKGSGLGILLFLVLFVTGDFGGSSAFQDTIDKPKNVLDSEEINNFVMETAGVTAKAKINLSQDLSENPEAGIKIYSIGRNSKGELVVQGGMVGVGHNFDYSSILYPDTLAIVHTHYFGNLRIPFGNDDDPVNTYGIPSYIISPEGDEVWVIGKNDGEIEFKDVSGGDPNPWMAFPSVYEGALLAMAEKAGGSPYQKENLVLVFGQADKAKYIGNVELQNGNVFWGGWHEVTFKSYEVLYGDLETLNTPIFLTAAHGEWITNFGKIYVLLRVPEEGPPETLFWDFVGEGFCIAPEIRQEFSLDPWLQEEISNKEYKIAC